MTDRKTLAARIEAATGPDRELDAAIAVFVEGGEIVWLTANGTMEQYPARKYQSQNHIGGFGKAPVPAYTASLDAAMMLTGASMDADDIATLFAQAVRACKAAKCDWRKHLPRFIAAAAIRAGGGQL